MGERPKLLILGGGAFVGSALVQAARARDWNISCLSRGIRPLPDDVTVLTADRLDDDSMAAALADAHYDYVVDTWSEAPRAVAVSARLLATSECRYGYISTRSVYTHYPAGGDESLPTVDADPDADSIDYPRDKRGAELALLRELGADRTVFYRAGGILGPEENIGRLPWWLGRMARGGDVLAPGPEDAPVQFVDVRDLAEFVLDSLSGDFSGPVDVVCPSGPVTMGSFLHDAVEATRDTRAASGAPDARLHWIDADWLLARDVGPWRELPIWGPPQSDFGGLHSSDTSRAVAAGLRSRPVIDTMRDTWASILAGETPADPVVPGLGMTPEREAQLLGEWGGLR